MANRNIDGVASLWQSGSPPNGEFWLTKDVTTTVSQVFKVFQGDNFMVQVQWTGNTTGTTKLEMCLDYREKEDGTVAVAGNWTDITANGVTKYPFTTKAGTDPAGATGGPVTISSWNVPACFLKFTYTPSGGAATRTMDGFWVSKGV